MVADVGTTQLEPAGGFSGAVMHPGQPGYDEARTVHDGMIRTGDPRSSCVPPGLPT